MDEAKFNINENLKINVYIKNSVEAALELIKRKKFNKIILISDIGLDLKEIKFLEDVREILGFQLPALFILKDIKIIQFIKKIQNILFLKN